jgi:uncharacterized membrane protein
MKRYIAMPPQQARQHGVLDTYIGTSAYLIVTVPAILLVTVAGGFALAGWLTLFYLPTLAMIIAVETKDSRRNH